MQDEVVYFEGGKFHFRFERRHFVVPDFFGLTKEDIGAFVDDVRTEFENDREKLVAFNIEGKQYPLPGFKPKSPDYKKENQPYNSKHGKPNKKSMGQQQQNKQHNDNNQDPARTPYNFVPLNEQVVQAENIPDFDRFDLDRKSGYIDLEITTKTPLFIRGEDEDFFGVNGQPIIPGSSLRGMVRTLVEIASHSQMLFIDDDKYYYRSIGDRKYRQMFTRNGAILAKAGFIEKNGDGFQITPSKKIKGSQFYRINGRFNASNPSFKENPDEFVVKGGNRTEKVFSTRDVLFLPAHPQAKKNYVFVADSKNQQEYAVVKGTDISTIKVTDLIKGKLIFSGSLGDRKHLQWIINLKDNVPPKNIDGDIIEDYRNDKNRLGYLDDTMEFKPDLLHHLSQNQGKAVPCFYLEDVNGNITAIGHTAFFRMPYKLKTKAHLYDAHLKEYKDKLDFTEGLFGDTAHVSSRVFFEDGNAMGNFTVDASKIPKVLSSPKPTTYQHYIEQGGSVCKYDWDSDAMIRGYKQYWHRPNHQWWEDPEKVKERESVYSDPIKAITNGKFHARIRFDNLSEAELGALLFVLELPDGCCHKLGLGKPHGLGSISIVPTLTIIDRKERYKKLFGDDGEWHTAAKQENNLNRFKNAFAKYVNKQLPNEDASFDAGKLWDLPRLQQLKTMLTFEHKIYDPQNEDWMERTRYMEIERKVYWPDGNPKMKDGKQETDNEYSNRPVLPKPSDVVKPATYKKKNHAHH